MKIVVIDNQICVHTEVSVLSPLASKFDKSSYAKKELNELYPYLQEVGRKADADGDDCIYAISKPLGPNVDQVNIETIAKAQKTVLYKFLEKLQFSLIAEAMSDDVKPIFETNDRDD